MNIIRMIAGIGLFLASSWISPYLSEVLGIPETLSFLTIGGILAFMGGIVFYSGVRQCTHWYRY